MNITTRFCPSPTGRMHLGNLRTALFSFLFARNKGGRFLLRIEDTDLARSTAEYAQAIITDLEWLGITWESSEECEGAHQGVLYQSQRLSVYETYYKKLAKQGVIYPCFCSEETLKAQRLAQKAAGKPPRYSGCCRALSQEEIEQKRAAGIPAAWRFAVPKETSVTFEDAVIGSQTFATRDIGDFIVRRSEGMPGFLFCNAVDDALTGVTVVIRGQDHLSNTVRQCLILKALDFPIPQYAHIALIQEEEGGALSKRSGSRSVGQLRVEGYLPGAILNYLTRLGHTVPHNQYLEQEALAQAFSLTQLSVASARFDQAQLVFWQKIAVGNLSSELFFQWAGEQVQALVPQEKRALFMQAVRGSVFFPTEVLTWAQILCLKQQHFSLQEATVRWEHPGAQQEKIGAFLGEAAVDYGRFVEFLKKDCGFSGKKLYAPLRRILTGQEVGPALQDVWDMLGQEEITWRIMHADL